MEVDPDPLPEDPPPEPPEDDALLAGGGEYAGVVCAGVVTAVLGAEAGEAADVGGEDA